MKTHVFLIFLFISNQYTAQAQEAESENNYVLVASDEWRKELIQFPLGFAPELNYKGFEDVRFAKGWGDKESEEFWTYKFVWYLDEDPKLNTEKIVSELKIYFDGLMNAVGSGRKIPKESILPTQATFNRDKKTKTYQGNVEVFDVFFTKAVMHLNVKIQAAFCKKTQKHIVYFEFSPQPYTHSVWDKMKAIKVSCTTS